MKYIMLDVPFGPTHRKTPIMFPDYLTHAIVAESLLANPLFAGAKVTSAGEFSSTDLQGIEMHGHSTSLKVDSDPSDSAHMPMLDYTHGIT